MPSCLQRLGIRQEVQSFFASYYNAHHDELIFDYGNTIEHFGFHFHRIPVTEELWVAGAVDLALEVLICGSALDAMAWLHFNYGYLKCIDHWACIALGASPSKTQTDWINHHLPKKRFHLLFGRDPLGHICDLKVAAWIRKKPLRIASSPNGYRVMFRSQEYLLEQLTLSAFERASGYRFNMPAHKPKYANSFTEQLKYGFSY